MLEANYDEVICPNCVTQFRAIPVNVQDQITALTAERDALTAKVASFESRIDRHVKTELALIVNNKSLKDAARLALDALEKSTPKPRKGDDDYCERGWRDQSSAIAALKAVL